MRYEIQKNGNLRIYPDEEELVELREKSDDELCQDKLMYEYFEYITCNGLTWVDPHEIAGLTEAPILSDGDPLAPNSKIWWYPNYMVRSPLKDIRDYGECIFTKAD